MDFPHPEELYLHGGRHHGVPAKAAGARMVDRGWGRVAGGAAHQCRVAIMSVRMPFVLLLLAQVAVYVLGDPLAPLEFPRHDGEKPVTQSQDQSYIIGEAIASEFNRHVPALSNNLRGELSIMRNDITQQFDSLKHYMDDKLDRMQRDAPSNDNDEEDPGLGEISAAHTPAATIRHNLAMAELRRLGADLTRAMDMAVSKLREEFRSSLVQLKEQVQNSSDNLAERLEEEFTAKSEESTTMLKKVFFLTRNQMALVQSQLSNISSVLQGEGNVGLGSSTSSPTTTTTTTTELPTTDTSTTTQSYTSPTTSTTSPSTTTTTEPVWLPRDCMESLKEGFNTSGVTTIRASPELESQRVWCEQEVDGGGWTVMLRRRHQPSQVDFRRDWSSYSEGFGNPEGEYWIGLETLYRLTKGNPYSLRVDMTWENEDATSLYDFFSVGPSRYGRRGYELNVGGYNKSSTGGDAMEYHNGMDFSTYDEDNDGASGGSCSEWSGGGGWWYNYCFYSNPTGIYPPADLPENTEVDHLLEWRKWQGYYTYLSSLVMMIRPN
ncbi:uncharacterized protein [Panulirus ornatus]|uniref:uncharacterized protein n=1 Tax=Panulirus ornatus TaxID=150431 RepID=UPI003A8433BF